MDSGRSSPERSPGVPPPPEFMSAARGGGRYWPGRPRLLRAEDVGGDGALQVLAAEGLVRRLWGGHRVAADVPPSPELRAYALWDSLSPAARRCVVGRATAVWVHTGAHPPRRLDLLVPAGVKIPAPSSQYAAHEASTGEDELVRIGQLLVTDVCRTAADVARWLPLETAAALLASLAGHPTFDARLVTTRLAALYRHRGVRHALELLRAMAPGDAQSGSTGSPAALEPVMR